ncbi:MULTISPECIES: tyrosinase family protein [Pseudomonas]|uniref:Tyrosinase copper-binding domain-containing protein n=1 Tax=Pseudomonas putida NBRC 14164 TaxID=1211579 RepID=A0ABM7ED67_PSEPU|nr:MULTISPECIES: tyrosinase family protein [Pseudomonas]EKT4462846.1 tyrosinase family protein [Pseudomonas putida]EKT4555618.1 tyrosinase family protein [Pseudomonas putida]MCX9135430.1 tyrosinase family protein [Pseudomonas sp. DCB_PUT]MDD1970371.1 tyrosinase family protein [Pseudomonas putida]MDO1462682.1 tyrosinase family protein [Pseudomonas putida]
MARERQDVATLGSGWDNKTLLHYALAVRELDKLPITDHNSWKFLGAIHGFDQELWIQRELINHDDPVPQALLDNTYSNQCQHGSWYFVSWHRGYLFSFEAIVAAKVKELTGEDWALPYWNYFNPDDPQALNLPAAFLLDTLPDGSPNPLKKYPRRPGLTKLEPGPADAFSLDAMKETDFTVDGGIGFGGGVSGDFVQFGGWTGDLERNPHNTVHRLIGGNYGFMADPLLAGLDPIFWLHHCNIDRLWEAWMSTAGKHMVRDPQWLNGPLDRVFIVPQTGSAASGITFTSRDTLPEGSLHRPYDNLSIGTGVTPGVLGVARVSMGSPDQQSVVPIGANASVVTVGAAPVVTHVDLDPASTRAGVAALGASVAGEQVTRLYLRLESVRGKAPSPLLDVYVNLPAGAPPENHPELHAGSLTLFGLNVASKTDSGHGGNGLGYTLDITDLAQRLMASGTFDPAHLQVTLVPGEQISANTPVTVERISVVKRTGIVS